MKKADMLSQIDYNTILNIMLPDDAVQLVIKDVETFYKRKHGLSRSVLNAILVRTIYATGTNLFNEAYLRKVAETFKAEGIKSAHTAIEHIERNHDYLRKLKRSGTSVEPGWLDQWVKDLAKEHQ